MEEVDKIRKKIGIDSLDKDTREKLFNEFIKSGGKVLTEKDIIKQRIREKYSKKHTPPQQITTPKPRTTPKPLQTESTKIVSQKKQPKPQTKTEEIKITLLDKIKVYLKAYFQNIINIKGFIKNKFFEKTLKEIPAAFNDLRIIGYILTSKDEKITNVVKENLNAISPIAYEIIYRLNNLPNNEIFDKAERMYKIFTQTKETTKPENIKDILKYTFKKLYLLHPFKDQAKLFLVTAFRAVNRYIPKSDLQKMEKLFTRVWEFLFEDYYNQIRTAINLIIGKEISVNSEYMIRFLEIKEEDYIGYLTEKMEISKIKEEKPKEAKEQEKKESKSNIPEEGIDLVNSINIRKIQESIKRKDFHIEYNDKIFITEALMEFYEKDIYPVLVLKAKYNIIFDRLKTTDIKKNLDDIYINMRTIRDKINDYYKTVEDIKSVESDVMIPINKKSGLINTKNIERTRISYQIRKEFMEILSKVKDTLETVLSDYESGGNILSNPEEIIEFEVDKIKGVETEKNFFEGENVINAMKKIQKIIVGIIFLISEGDLGGSNVKLEKQVYLTL